MSSIPNIPDPLTSLIYAELCRSLPPWPDDTADGRHLHDQLAMTAVAHLLPENAAEACAAVQIVAAQTHARDALGDAAQPGLDPDAIRRCRAQAASMMRQADSGIRTLLRMQAERQKAEDAARPAAMQRAGYWFRSASIAESPGLTQGPDPEPDHEASPELTRGPAATLPAEPPGSTQGAPPPPTPPKPEYGVMTPAERYVTLYPDRATRILAAGGLPARLGFAPPEPEVIDELLASDSPLVHTFRQARAA